MVYRVKPKKKLAKRCENCGRATMGVYHCITICGDCVRKWKYGNEIKPSIATKLKR